MHYEKSYLDDSRYFSGNITISKERLISVAMDTSLYGASNIKSAVAVASLCEKYNHGSGSCSRVVSAKEALLKQKRRVEELVSSGAPEDVLSYETSVYNKMSSDFIALSRENCKNCSALRYITSNPERRLNYARYDSRQETLSHIKVLLGLCLLIPTVEDLRPEDTGTDMHMHLLNIGIFSNVCGLSSNSARDSLHYWETAGLIHTAPYSKGTYAVTFSKNEISRKFAKAGEGGAGYISLPFAAVKTMLNVHNVDLLRLLIMVYLNMDSDLYDRNYSVTGRGVTGTGQYVKFVRLHAHASYRSLIAAFNNEMLGLTDGAIRLSVTAKGEGRYDSLKISMTLEYAPKQKGLSEAIDAESKKLLRGLTEEDVRKYESVWKAFAGPGNSHFHSMISFLFPKENGQTWVNEALPLRPHKLSETLIPALETIKDRFGDGFIREALVSMFRHKGDILSRLFTEVKPESSDFEPLIRELSAYLVGTARDSYNARFSSWKNFEYDITA